MAKAEPPKRPVLPDRAILSALDVLGADPAMLTDEERRSLDEQGFVNLGQLLTLDQTREMKRRLRKQLAREGEAAGTEVHQEGGADRLSNFNFIEGGDARVLARLRLDQQRRIVRRLGRCLLGVPDEYRLAAARHRQPRSRELVLVRFLRRLLRMRTSRAFK